MPTKSSEIVLETVLHGKETEEAATHWWVFHAMSDTIHPTLYKPIEMEIDIKEVTAQASIPGMVESTGGPIRPDHTADSVHRAQIVIPGGIEFEVAEMGSASTKTGSESADKTQSKRQLRSVEPAQAYRLRRRSRLI